MSASEHNNNIYLSHILMYEVISIMTHLRYDVFFFTSRDGMHSVANFMSSAHAS